jgi:hypothetical protein
MSMLKEKDLARTRKSLRLFPFAVVRFGLLKSGDLITICPVVPNISNLSLAWVQNTLKTSIERWSQVQDKAESVQYYWVQKWLEEVLEQDACTYKF